MMNREFVLAFFRDKTKEAAWLQGNIFPDGAQSFRVQGLETPPKTDGKEW